MGQIANQMLLEFMAKMARKLKEKGQKKDGKQACDKTGSKERKSCS